MKAMLRKLWCDVKEWLNEMVAILLAVALFLLSPKILRWIDPTAGSYDAGVLQVIIFSVVGLLTFSFLSWIGLKINFCEVFTYGQKEFTKDFKSLDAWQKVKILLLLYFGYLLAFVLMARVL